ncbi:hypothetical protein DYU05_14150 [Mucilaginibacter terrenus]|uniref:Uncharacterized protein n=1 Tax=Mucilaginibacter terrenus TaxID=2482727 RepID=A0A3E2NRC0_9SPHI|nr:hypothetical protein DYU05_14150 [Mucilaginibacter terrenus]
MYDNNTCACVKLSSPVNG